MTTRTFQSYADIVNVQDYGAVGDGTTNDTAAIQAAIDAAFVVCTTNSSTVPPGNKQLYFPAGIYKTTAALNLHGVFGAKISGAGRFTTQITNVTAGSKVFAADGYQYNHMSDMLLSATGSGSVCFDMDKSGTYCTSQSNTFQNMFFTTADYGVSLALTYAGAGQCSENLFLNCFFISHAVAAIYCGGGNALQQTMIGGNIQSCDKGIWVAAGNFDTIHGVGFQTCTDADIQTEGFYNAGMTVSGCRSESTNFIINNGGVGITISSCFHSGLSNGHFYSGTGGGSILSCGSALGDFNPSNECRMTVDSCYFGRADWLNLDIAHLSYIPNNAQPFEVWLRNVLAGDFIWMNTRITSDGSTIHTDDDGVGILALTDAATIATDAALSNISGGTYQKRAATVFTVTLTNNRTLGNPTNLIAGQFYNWVIKQDATGTRTLAYGSTFTFPGGAPTLTVTANATDVITGFYDGVKLRCQITKAYA